MATQMHVPGPAVEATPSFSCALPDGWLAREAPGALVVFSLAGRDEVSVLVDATRVAKEVDLREIAVRSFARQRRAHGSVSIDSQRVGRFGDRVVYVRGVTVTDEEPVAQVQGFFFAPAEEHRQTADVFSLVGSCPASDIAEFGPVFIDILASISFADVRAEAVA